MDEQESGLTPDELDSVLSDLQTGEDVAHPHQSADAIFLGHLVNTARSTELHQSFSARLDVQIRQALNRRPLPRAAHSTLVRSPVPPRFDANAWPATSYFRHITLTVASTVLIAAFIVLNTVTWSASGPGVHAITFTPSLSDNSLVLLPAHTIAARDALTTGIVNKESKETAHSATRATIILRAIQAPSPPGTPIPIPGSIDSQRFTETPLQQ